MSTKEKYQMIALMAILAVLLTGILSFLKVFKRNDSLISDEGKELLSNKKDREAILDALRNNKTEVTTSKGKFEIG